ncbi:hypothetical protein CISIN_1g0483971mg, partial [Citrus sinensis]
ATMNHVTLQFSENEGKNLKYLLNFNFP